MSDEPVLVDGDGHVAEPLGLWEERMDRERWGDLTPRLSVEEQAFYIGGVARSGPSGIVSEVARIVGIGEEELLGYWRRTHEALGRQGGFDPRARLADMDRDGLTAAVIYPSSALFFGPVDPIPAVRDPRFVLACQQAYNDWVAEYCSADRSRLFAMACVPLQDVDLAIGEARRAVGDLGLKGIWIRPSAYVDDKPLSNSVYDPFWAACSELDVPVAFHPAVHVDTPGACRKFGLVHDSPSLNITNSAVDQDHGGSGFGQAIGNTVDMIVTMGRLLMGGVCERFPSLDFIFLESGGGWCATQLERMDEQIEEFPLEGRLLSLRPSEYFRRQCYISFDPGEWNLAASAEFIGPDRILWASDYPHPEYDPAHIDGMRKRISGLSEEAQRQILGGNAVRAYRLPVGV